MPKTVNVDYVTKTVEIKVNDSETESIAAATAVAAAKNAKDYATSASSSANSAQTTAAALTAWLEDKETLTAPAVDPTLTIIGAAADAQVVGDKITKDEKRIEVIDGFMSVEWVDGSISGTAYYNGKRIHSRNSIHLPAGAVISLTDDENYKIRLSTQATWYGSITITTEGNYIIEVRKDPDAAYTSMSELSSQVSVYNPSNKLVDVENRLDELDDEIVNIKRMQVPIPTEVLFETTPALVVNRINTDLARAWIAGGSSIGSSAYSETYIDFEIGEGKNIDFFLDGIAYDTEKASLSSVSIRLYDGTTIKGNDIVFSDPSFPLKCSVTTPADITRIRIYLLFSTLIDKTGQSGEWLNVSASTVYINSGIYEVNNNIVKTGQGEVEVNNAESVDQDAYLYRNALPTYYTEQPQNPASYNDDSYVDVKIDTIPAGKHFIFVTDDHWVSNAKKNIPLIQYVRKRIKAKTVINGGDFLNCDTTSYIGKQHLTDSAGRYRAAFGDDFTPVRGNHDDNCNNGTGLPDEEKEIRLVPPSVVYKTVFGSLGPKAHVENVRPRLEALDLTAEHVNELVALFNMTYYVDDDINKIRYIIVNTGATGYKYPLDDFGVYSYQESWLNLEFIAEAMQTIKEGYDVVVAAHMFANANSDSIDENDRVPTYGFVKAVGDLLAALKKKTSVIINMPYQTGNANFVTFMGGSSPHAYSFSSSNNVGKMLVITGHYHNDGVCVYDGNNRLRVWDGTSALTQTLSTVEIPYIQVTTDAIYQDLYGGPEMTINTVTEQAFDVVTINDQGITLTRIGAGEDRMIPINS